MPSRCRRPCPSRVAGYCGLCVSVRCCVCSLFEGHVRQAQAGVFVFVEQRFALRVNCPRWCKLRVPTVGSRRFCLIGLANEHRFWVRVAATVRLGASCRHGAPRSAALLKPRGLRRDMSPLQSVCARRSLALSSIN